MLAYDLRGEGAPITFLHGFAQRGSSWEDQIASLPPGWQALSVDLPGHGPASKDEAAASMGAASEALLALWDELGRPRSHLVGYSLGGRLALHVAAHHPERIASLVAVSSHAGLAESVRPERRRGDDELADRIERQGVAWFSEYWAALPLFAGLARRGSEFRAVLDGMRRTNREAGLAASLRGMGAGATEPFWDRLGSITAPTLLVAGAEDEKYVAMAELLQRHIPGSCLAIVPGAGHSVHLERPDDFARLLASHLARASAPPDRKPAGN